MANPVKAAKQMFDQFLAKADPEAPELSSVPEDSGLTSDIATMGGLARAASLSQAKRSQIAKRAAKSRWRKHTKK
jgi:hypothetical protein